MKTLKTIFAILSIAIFTVSCSNDDDNSPKFQTENPLAAYYTQTGFTTSTNFINSGDYEFGLVFTPTVKGKIKAITLKLPATNPSLRVTIWDYTTKTVLRSETLNVATADVRTMMAKQGQRRFYFDHRTQGPSQKTSLPNSEE